MFGYTIFISIIDVIAYGMMITVGIFTLSGDIIIESNYKFHPFMFSLFLVPLFMYDLLSTYFLTNALYSNWIIFAWDLSMSRNSLFSLMVGLDIVGIVLFTYSPETYPMTKKQKYEIERYMTKAKKIAENYESE